MCSPILTKSAIPGIDYVIEGNRRVWYTEDGGRYEEIPPQYSGPVAKRTGDGMICNNGGYYGVSGLF